MSENSSFPFEGDTGAVAAEASPDRRKLFLLLGVAAVVTALIGYFVAVPLLTGTTSASNSISAGTPVPHAQRPVTVPAKPKVVPRTFNDVVGRDPFAPLVTAPVVRVVTATAPAAAPAAPVAPVGPAPSTPVTTPGKITFAMLGTSGSKAFVTVDGTKYTVATGQLFAKYYRLLKVSSGSCASFSYGEMRFSLCKGQTFIF